MEQTATPSRMRFSHVELRKYTAEIIGAFMLCIVVLVVSQSQLGILAPLLAGIMLGISVYTVGHISGAHLNPAVTLGALSVGKIGLKDAIGYIISQFIGGALALLLGSFFMHKAVSFTQNMTGLTTGAFVAETLGAVIFTFGVAAVLNGKVNQSVTGVVIGASLMTGVFVAALSGGVGILNPAVAFSAGTLNVVSGLAPIVGAAIGFNLYKVLRSE